MKLIKWTIQLLITITIPILIIVFTSILLSYIPNDVKTPKGMSTILGFLISTLFYVFGYMADIFGKWWDSKLK